MNVKESLKVFKDPCVLFPLYLLKSVILSFGMIDFWILGIISFILLSEKFMSKVEAGINRYFDTKEKVISENTFRANVNSDMSKVFEELNLLKAITSKTGIFGGKK